MKKLKKKISLLLWVAIFSMVLALAGCSKYTDHPEPAPTEQELQAFSTETEWTMGTESLVQNSEATESGEAETTGMDFIEETSEIAAHDPFSERTQFRNNDRFEEHYQKFIQEPLKNFRSAIKLGFVDTVKLYVLRYLPCLYKIRYGIK